MRLIKRVAPRAVWYGLILWLGLGGVGLLAGCNVIEIRRSGETVPPARSGGIVFVTATPPPDLRLAEGQRYLVPSPTPPPLTPATPRPYYAGANELGQVMVLEYHRIGYPEMRYQRTPDNFRADLQRLYTSGYYPVNFVDILRGLPEVPAGKKPIAISFDDSDISQFRVLEGNLIDLDCAVGIMLDFHNQHLADWPTRATFFVLGDDTNDYYTVFGQSGLAKAKAQFLVDLGMELGSHTVSHVDLSQITAERIYWELAVSKHVIESMVPGYTVQSLSVPYGGFPFTVDFLKTGQWGDYSYTYLGNAAAWGGPNVSPYHTDFDPYRVSRLEVTDTSLDHWLTYFEQNPGDYYVADGDPNRITFPELQAGR